MNATGVVIGSLQALRRYPTKSLRGEALECAEIGETGIPGDRATALFAREGAREGKTYRGKENERLHLFDDPSAAVAFARERGTGVDVRRDEHFFDDAPISLIVDAWLCDLRVYLGYAVEWERFRPNLFVRSQGRAVPLERALVDCELALGPVRLRVRAGIRRCVTITYHPDGEPSDPRILEYVAQRRENLMGVYCDVVTPGAVCRGDRLLLL
ncbi:MAG TPA: MOSC domain-containing protein [Candidatus Cybelea sp.]|nr:MOSC domain-containing protein [Candidatus Cybelea sp.]